MFVKGTTYVGKGAKKAANAISGKKFKLAVEKAKTGEEKAKQRLDKFNKNIEENRTETGFSIDFNKKDKLEKQLLKKLLLAKEAQNALDKFKKRRSRIITTSIIGGGLAAGIPAAISLSNTNSENNTNNEEGKQPALYRFDQQRGWQEYNPKTNQYEDQQIGFGVDSHGSTNFYNGIEWLKPTQYSQSSDGYVYDSNGNVVGSVGDMLEARKAGYDNIFDYRAKRNGFNSSEEVAYLQKKLGINVDGKWGMQTQNAYEKAINSAFADQYNPKKLFTTYQRQQ